MANQFQFLSRNSVRWDLVFADIPSTSDGVSIPQSEFCPLGLPRRRWRGLRLGCFNSSVGILSVGTQPRAAVRPLRRIVSIPQSEFCPLGPGCGWGAIRNGWCFNSSVGILSVGTRALTTNSHITLRVSIPQSEFCPLGPGFSSGIPA